MLSPVSLTPAINWLPVSTTPLAINCIDDRGLLLLQNYLRPPKSATAADIVIGHSHENAQRYLTFPDQRAEAPEATKTTSNQNGITVFSFGGLRGLGSRCVGCLCMQLFMAVPMTPSAAVADFGGRKYRRFIPFNFGSSPPPWRPCSCHRR
jgi:hypothetical protein